MKYMLLLSSKTEDQLRDVYQSAADVLRESSLRHLHLRPQIVLFDFPGDLRSAVELFPPAKVLHDCIVVFPIGDQWSGRVLTDLSDRLNSFFYPRLDAEPA